MKVKLGLFQLMIMVIISTVFAFTVTSKLQRLKSTCTKTKEEKAEIKKVYDGCKEKENEYKNNRKEYKSNLYFANAMTVYIDLLIYSNKSNHSIPKLTDEKKIYNEVLQKTSTIPLLNDEEVTLPAIFLQMDDKFKCYLIRNSFSYFMYLNQKDCDLYDLIEKAYDEKKKDENFYPHGNFFMDSALKNPFKERVPFNPYFRVLQFNNGKLKNKEIK